MTRRIGETLIIGDDIEIQILDINRGQVRVIISSSRSQPSITPFAVAACICVAFWFTASTSFANPAVTLARAARNTFAGIRPEDILGFVVAQLLATIVANRIFV